DDQNADGGAADAAKTARQARASDDHRRDRIEFVAEAGARLRRIESSGKNDAGQSGEGGANGVDPDRVLAHLDAGEPRHFLASADRVEGAAGRAELKDDPGDDSDRDHHADRHRQEAEVANDGEIENQSGKLTICSPLVIMLATPRAIDIIA